MRLQRKLTRSEMRTYIEEHKATLKRLYIASGLTAKQLAESQNIFYTQAWAKELVKALPKGMGLGGARKFSGNKKGILFCGKCRRKKEDCICNIIK